jgi:hypothetical protein
VAAAHTRAIGGFAKTFSGPEIISLFRFIVSLKPGTATSAMAWQNRLTTGIRSQHARKCLVTNTPYVLVRSSIENRVA